jgi:hypothetical protein
MLRSSLGLVQYPDPECCGQRGRLVGAVVVHDDHLDAAVEVLVAERLQGLWQVAGQNAASCGYIQLLNHIRDSQL